MKTLQSLLCGNGRPGLLAGSLALLLASCTTITTFGNSDGTDGQAESEGSGGIIPTSSSEPPSTESDSTTSASGSSGDDSSGEDSNSFLNNSTTSDSGSCGDQLPDGAVGHTTFECSLLRQDCCQGDACRAWANDGGPNWNSTRCAPIDPNPAGAGEPCTVVASSVSGLDSCDVGLMCWEVDLDTLEGTCIEYCAGTSDEPTCSNPDDVCGIFNDGFLPLCLPSCDLLANDCDADDVCIPAGDETFGCIDERYPRCPAGTTEINPDFGMDCAQNEPCCASFCDLSDEEACGADFECTPLPEPYSTYPDLGVCVSMLEP